jgi:hypothetical protein
MKIGLEICFAEKSVDSNYFMEMYTRYVRFTPYAFSKKYKTQQWDEKKYIKSITSAKPGDSLSVYDLSQNIITMGSTGSKVPFTSFTLEQDRDIFLPASEEIEQIVTNKNFISAYLSDAQYVEIQSTYFLNNIKHKGFGEHLYHTIKDTPTKRGSLGDIEYDIRYNPGRRDLISYTWLLACWKMWFGEPFFKLVPKEKLLGFKGAYEIKELPNGNVYVQLFEKVDESHTYENMRLQQKWRDEMGYNELISKYS